LAAARRRSKKCRRSHREGDEHAGLAPNVPAPPSLIHPSRCMLLGLTHIRTPPRSAPRSPPALVREEHRETVGAARFLRREDLLRKEEHVAWTPATHRRPPVSRRRPLQPPVSLRPAPAFSSRPLLASLRGVVSTTASSRSSRSWGGLHGLFGHVSPSGLARPGPSPLLFFSFFFYIHQEFLLGRPKTPHPHGPVVFPPD
jgi:hypothetical protein